MKRIVLVAHNIRSAHNTGSLLRTAEGLGITKVYLTGYTPYPKQADDERLPHLAEKITRQISKTALGAEKTVPWEHQIEVFSVLDQLKSEGYRIAALEQTVDSIDITGFKTANDVALIVGREVEGLEKDIIEACDCVLEIPMPGEKESFNVAVAAGIALYHLVFQA